jgi:hypothetical protein
MSGREAVQTNRMLATTDNSNDLSLSTITTGRLAENSDHLEKETHRSGSKPLKAPPSATPSAVAFSDISHGKGLLCQKA